MIAKLVIHRIDFTKGKEETTDTVKVSADKPYLISTIANGILLESRSVTKVEIYNDIDCLIATRTR